MANKHAKALRCKTCQRNLPVSCFKFTLDKRWNSRYYETWACLECQGRNPTVLRSLVCPRCGTSFETTHSQKIYCTQNCERKANRKYNGYTPATLHKIFPKECAECGKPFYGRRPHSVSCSPECKREHGKRHDREYARRKRIKFKEECPLFHWAEYQKLKIWKKANPEKVRLGRRISKNRRLARQLENGIHDFVEEEWFQLLKIYNYRCFYCGQRGGDMTRDHIVPLAKGGEHTMENIVPCCASCNSHKRQLDLKEFVLLRMAA